VGKMINVSWFVCCITFARAILNLFYILDSEDENHGRAVREALLICHDALRIPVSA
jgi:hypothetical protein